VDPIALADAGPVAILLVGIAAVALGFVRGYIVPGYMYKQEREARIVAETQAQRNSELLLKATNVVDKSIDARTSGDDAAA
jgi:hypothetical protein